MLTSAQQSWQEKNRRLNPHKHYQYVTEGHVRRLYEIKNTREGWKNMTRDRQMSIILDSVVDCTPELAEKLVDCSIASFEYPADFRAVPKEKSIGKTRKKTEVKSQEVDSVMQIIVERFSNQSFQNKDLSPHITDLSSRQIPSRLKKLVDGGKIEDLGGSPKTYKLKRGV
jgi:hypothetical protein